MCKRFERMMKCLELTASTNDAEALAAIRQANRIREELGLSWSGIAIKAKQAVPSPDASDLERQFDEMFGGDDVLFEKSDDPWVEAAREFVRHGRRQ